MTKKDYYEILEVSRTATKTEIKKAYRKKAIQYHPDKNPGDKEAEEMFKLAAEAYEVLSDDDKRARYDRYGHAAFEHGNGGGFSGNMDIEDIFRHFGDIFGGHFGGFGGFGGRQSHNQVRVKGSTMRIKLKLNLEEIAQGVKKKIKVKRKVKAPGVTYKTCHTCHGRGQVAQVRNTFLGRMQTVTNCPTCSGTGEIIDHRPAGADAHGMIVKEETIDIDIPAGVTDGVQLKVAGKGNEAPGNNGINGDLLVIIQEKEHDAFQREGKNIHYQLYISFPEAALGTEKEIKTLNGKVRIKIEEGTQSGKIFRLRGKGIPSLDGYPDGDMLIHVNVWTPTKLSEEQKDFLNKMRDDDNFHPRPKKEDKNFFEKIRDLFS